MSYKFDFGDIEMAIKGLGGDGKSTTISAKRIRGEIDDGRAEKRRYSIDFIIHSLKPARNFYGENIVDSKLFDAYSVEEALAKLYNRYSNLHQSRIEIVNITDRPLISNLWFAC